MLVEVPECLKNDFRLLSHDFWSFFERVGENVSSNCYIFFLIFQIRFA